MNAQIPFSAPHGSIYAKRIIDYVQFLPPQMRLTPTNITSVGLWGGTAALGAIWLVQVQCCSILSRGQIKKVCRTLPSILPFAKAACLRKQCCSSCR